MVLGAFCNNNGFKLEKELLNSINNINNNNLRAIKEYVLCKYNLDKNIRKLETLINNINER